MSDSGNTDGQPDSANEQVDAFSQMLTSDQNQYRTRRELRNQPLAPGQKPPRRKWPWVLGVVALLLAGAGAVGTWFVMENWDRIEKFMGWEESNDYEGNGEGEVVVAINNGDLGSDIAINLHENGVTKSYQAFYGLLVELENESGKPVIFYPGTYKLSAKMSAQSALDALQNLDNKLVQSVLIPEGKVLNQTLELLAAGTGIPVADFEKAIADPTKYGITAAAKNVDGYLFPARYNFDPGLSAEQIIQIMVDRTFQSLDAKGVAVEDRHKVMTMAALIQREAGRNTEDFYKVSRVFTNRLEQNWLLQSDATVAYGTGKLHTVWTTDADRADTNNPYNTYVHKGLPVGPIGAAGDLAIDAALNPTAGDWMYFVPINLRTGETVFSRTMDEHNRAVAQLRSWCRASAENSAYCA
ncbi:MAG: endolytic transglycosylase MltG [Microbacteriaceae bacterium]|nr:endolytic transglycosylase MltG [Microbacteriaceae bacterium]